MSNRVLCKFFLHGACLKGENCEFSHDWKDSENNVCTYYQKGACTYGSRCRYDHVRVSRPYLSDTSSSTKPHHSLSSDSVSLTHPGNVTSTRPLSTTTDTAWNLVARDFDSSESDSINELRCLSPSEKPLCSFAAAGNCPRGQKCPHVHGDECLICGKQCLHPFRADEREEHLRICLKRQKHIDALKNSQEIECSVCLERVLSKSIPAERKFGLLSECSHPFCISCIRNWRGSSPVNGMDVNSALRACPICRKVSYYVIPSVIWYVSDEEKQEIVESYKAKLRYFDFGNGTCPFGSSCFYKHAYPDGSLAETTLRYLGDENGDVVIAKNYRISDFFGRLHIG